MYDYANRDGRKRVSRTTVGLCTTFGSDDTFGVSRVDENQLGEILFCFGHIGTRVISHECGHAAFAVMRCYPRLIGEMSYNLATLHLPQDHSIRKGVRDMEEVLCTWLGDMASYVVGKMCDLRIFEAETKWEMALPRKKSRKGSKRRVVKGSRAVVKLEPSEDGRESVRSAAARITST